MSEILRDYGKLQINHERFLQEEEKYLNQVLKSHAQVKVAIKTWADFLADMYDAGYYQFPKKTICAHICDRLMVSAGWTEGEIVLVRRILPPEYKDPSKDRYSLLGNGNNLRSNDRNFAVYDDFDQMAKGRKSQTEMRGMSQAEFLEFIKRRRPLNKEYQKRLREENKEMEEVASEKGISLEPEKESRDKVPEQYHAVSEAYSETRELGKALMVIGQRIINISDLMYEYAPNPQVSAYIVNCLKKYYPIIRPTVIAMKLLTRGFDNLLINYDDDKYRACPSDWLKIGYDQIVNAGSHGSGVINAIRTGEWVFRPSKDPNFDMVMVPLEREFTREQVGDKTAKDLLVKARNFLQMQQVERAFMEWQKKTVIEEIINSPDDYWKSIKR